MSTQIVRLFITAVVCVQAFALQAQQKKYEVQALAFYNLENLFDTEDDPLTNDEEFTPRGANRWTEERYRRKQNNMASVISKLGKDYSPQGAAVVGVCEIENRKVLEDLVANPALLDAKYQIVHYDSPDRRGIDVGLLYNPRLFQVSNSKTIAYQLPEDTTYVTRDILLVSGKLAGELIHIFVNHWPSRFGGAKSAPLREHAASLVRNAVDSLYNLDREAKIVIMGDFNDDPVDKSLRIVLAAKKKKENVEDGELFNTMWPHYDRGIGSLGYQGKWNLFDQIIVSYPLLKKDRSSFRMWKSEVFNREYLITQEGRYKGYPFRTFAGGTFQNGYSDHFPVLLYLAREAR